jgi:hypothetical protein
MPINFFFASFFAMGRLQNIDLFFSRLVLALQKFMVFGAPAMLIFCSFILFKAFFQSVIGQKNQETKLTFISALIWGFFAVLSFYLLTEIALNEPLAFICASITIGFSLIIPLCIALIYLYSAIFCCEDTHCNRAVFSGHPPFIVVLLMYGYLSMSIYWLFKAFKEQKLIYIKPKSTRNTNPRLLSGKNKSLHSRK